MDEKSAPQFCHLAKYADAPQYSEAFVEWVVEQYRSDSEFFANARARYKEPRFVKIGRPEQAAIEQAASPTDQEVARDVTVGAVEAERGGGTSATIVM